jgi:hypothetical protein
VVINIAEEAAASIIRVEMKMDITYFAKSLAAVYQATFYNFLQFI